MDYNLTSPCAHCPFRTDIPAYLKRGRAQEIYDGIETDTFTCHKTVQYDEGVQRVRPKTERHCAGALIMLEHMDEPSQMMRLLGRIGAYNPEKLNMDAPVFDDAEDWIDAQPER